MDQDYKITTTGSSTQTSIINAPLLSKQPVTAEFRFGASLHQAELFKYKMTHMIRNEQLVRAKWEIEWQSAEQSQKANAYLYELLGNKVNYKIIPVKITIKKYTE